MILNRTTLISLLILLTNLGVIGQDCDSCKTYFDTLIIILKKPNISKSDLQKSWQITSKLYSYRFADYPVVINGVAGYTHTLSRTYADICIKSRSITGVYDYIRYMRLTNWSAEEERMIDFERVFVRYPQVVLHQIGVDTVLLNNLVFGFLFNRRFGPKNPYENNDYMGETYIEGGPKEILNSINCKKIFFETYPSLKAKYIEFKYPIDFIINNLINELKAKK